MKKTRLLTLARHLESGKLGHKKFDFSNINEPPFPRKAAVKGCGTSGCAVGELPIAFPKDWFFKKLGRGGLDFEPRRHGGAEFEGPFEGAEVFFDLSQGEIYFLFDPFAADQPLPPRATKEQVARRIRLFVRFNGNQNRVVKYETDSE